MIFWKNQLLITMFFSCSFILALFCGPSLRWSVRKWASDGPILSSSAKSCMKLQDFAGVDNIMTDRRGVISFHRDGGRSAWRDFTLKRVKKKTYTLSHWFPQEIKIMWVIFLLFLWGQSQYFYDLWINLGSVQMSQNQWHKSIEMKGAS